MLFAGHGTNDNRWDGGNGGSIELIAGEGHGRSTDSGASAYSKGGSLLIKSGPSVAENPMDPASTTTEGLSTSQLEPVSTAMVEMSVLRQDHQTANQVVILECFWPMLELQACPAICLLAPALLRQGLISTMMVIQAQSE